uniref:Uncharacterized protein n=1 Tax=Romanomermis culicivorax TaxID=13658 RepID=A0A915IW21_ROMCU
MCKPSNISGTFHALPIYQEYTYWKNRTPMYLLKSFLGGARAVPPLANVRVGVTIPTRAQQKWPDSDPWVAMAEI